MSNSDTKGCYRFLSESRRWVRSGERPHKTTYLEVDVAQQDSAEFYSGFFGDITGVFVTTYRHGAIGEPVAVKLRFSETRTVALEGHVEWTREINPLMPETSPGLGIRFTEVPPEARKWISVYLAGKEARFYDGEPSVTQAVAERDVNRSGTVPPPVSPADDLPFDTTEPFVAGLVRDVLVLVRQSDPVGVSDTVLAGPSFRRQTETGGRSRRQLPRRESRHLEATVLSDTSPPMSFYGGFMNEDSGYRVFVATEHPAAIGSRVSLQLRLPGGRRLHASGEVKWVRRQSSHLSRHTAPPGMGVCLDGVKPLVWQCAFPNQIDLSMPIYCEAC